MENKCFCCNIDTDQHKLIKCCICKNNYKYSCVGLTINEVKIISTKHGLSYTCTNCTAVGKDLNELKAVITELKNQVAELKSQNSDHSKKNINSNEFSEIVQEVIERQKRCKNLIIYGINEADNLDKDARLRHDETEAKNVLNFLSCDTNSTSLKPVRLGKYLPDQQRPRPIRITFTDEQSVQNVIRRAKQLRNSDYKHVSISQDRTPKQLEHYRNLKKELDVRKANGENNLAIRTVHGIPKIVSLN